MTKAGTTITVDVRYLGVVKQLTRMFNIFNGADLPALRTRCENLQTTGDEDERVIGEFVERALDILDDVLAGEGST